MVSIIFSHFFRVVSCLLNRLVFFSYNAIYVGPSLNLLSLSLITFCEKVLLVYTNCEFFFRLCNSVRAWNAMCNVRNQLTRKSCWFFFSTSLNLPLIYTFYPQPHPPILSVHPQSPTRSIVFPQPPTFTLPQDLSLRTSRTNKMQEEKNNTNFIEQLTNN